jgi:hypothetical protein
MQRKEIFIVLQHSAKFKKHKKKRQHYFLIYDLWIQYKSKDASGSFRVPVLQGTKGNNCSLFSRLLKSAAWARKQRQ